MKLLSDIGKVLLGLIIVTMIFSIGYLAGNSDKANRIFTPLVHEAYERGYDSALNKKIVIKVDSTTYTITK